MSPQNIPQGDDRIEKLVIVLGQRMNALNKTLQMIAANLQGVESHLRQIAISSTPAPNYQRPLSEYPTFDWPSIGAMILSQDEDGATSVERKNISGRCARKVCCGPSLSSLKRTNLKPKMNRSSISRRLRFLSDT